MAQDAENWLKNTASVDTKAVTLSSDHIRWEDGVPLVVDEHGEVRGWLLLPYPPEELAPKLRADDGAH